MTTIAVLLTVFNRKTKTLACLETLYNQELPAGYDIDVYLTDDGCTDGTPEAVRDKFPEVHIIKGDGNLYWSRGMRLAWQTASTQYNYDFYLWLNDDTLLYQDAIKLLLEDSAEAPDSIIIGSTCSSDNSNLVTYGGHYAGRVITPNGYLQRCQTFNGNVVLVPQKIFQQIGNLDPVYQHAIGDLDYGWMVTRAGLYNYASKKFVAICDRNPRPPKWVCPDIPFIVRWQNFQSPLGYGQPRTFFHFNRKNFGLLKAILVWTSNHIRVFFPWIWIRKS